MAPIDCKAAMRQLWEYLDGELTAERMEAVREHLDLCAHCYEHSDAERAFLEAIAATGEGRPDCPERVRERILSALREAGFSPTAE